MKRVYVYQFCLFCLFAYMLVLSGCGGVEFLESEGVEEQEQGLKIKGLSLSMYKGENRETLISADEGKLYEKYQRLVLYDPVIKYYEKGKYVAEVVAFEGILYLDTLPGQTYKKNDVVLNRNVVYKNEQGAILKTDKLIWDNENEMISSESEFRMEIPRGDSLVILTGKKFETDKTMTKWKDYGASMKRVPRNT